MRPPFPRRRLLGVALCVLLGGALLCLSGRRPLAGRRSVNLLGEDSLVVYRGYLDRREEKTIARILLFSRCLLEGTQLCVDTKQVEVSPIEGQCPWKWAPGCDWNSFIVSAEISDHSSLKEVTLSMADRSLTIPLLQLPKKRRSGLSVCVPPLYWFSNWPALVQFLELWLLQGASHFWIYVHSISRATREVLRFYEHKKLVTVIHWNELPSGKGVNPNLSLYRLGHSLAHNDCGFRAPSLFTALVDVDEFVVPLGNETLLERLSAMLQSNPLAGSFLFGHSKLRFVDLDWTRPDFSWLQKTVHERGNGPPKAVFLPERVDVLLTHQARSHLAPFSAVQVAQEEALLFHARSNWAHQSVPGNFSAIALFGEAATRKIQEAFGAALRFLKKAGFRNPTPNRNVSSLVQRCLRDWKEDGCKTPFYACYGALHSAEEWTFSIDSDDYAIL